jgi:hypothetical protein
MIRFIHLFQMILNNINFVKILILRPKQPKLKPKLNASCLANIYYNIKHKKTQMQPKKGSL